MNWLKEKLSALVVRVPADMQAEYDVHCMQKNNRRFYLLPFFNILTQLACMVIYLYIYPTTFPDMPRLNVPFFLVLSAAYILINLVFIRAFGRLKASTPDADWIGRSHVNAVVFLLVYILLESTETIIEVRISGNIYRFLATFFMVSFLPQLRRREKVGLLVLYALLTELGLFLFVPASSNRFEEIVLLMLIAGIAIAIISQNSTIRTFLLQQNLVNANKALSDVNQALERMAVTDALTQISNRRAFDSYIPQAWSSCCRDGSYLSILMIDIDDFKAYNDHYGHQMGDTALYRVAQSISTHFSRETDMVARYGGEEFVALTIKNTPDEAQALAEKVRADVEVMNIEHVMSGVKPVVTISVGLSSTVGDKNVKYGQALKLADDALYQAKKGGKNRVSVVQSNPESLAAAFESMGSPARMISGNLNI